MEKSNRPNKARWWCSRLLLAYWDRRPFFGMIAQSDCGRGPREGELPGTSSHSDRNAPGTAQNANGKHGKEAAVVTFLIVAYLIYNTADPSARTMSTGAAPGTPGSQVQEGSQLSGLPGTWTNNTDIRPEFKNRDRIPCSLQCTRPIESIAKGHEFCNSLDWDAPLQHKVCSTQPELCAGWDREREEALEVEAYLDQAGSFQLLVHYQYHESKAQPDCERVNKRINLEVFIQQAVLQSSPNVMFHFSSSGITPTVKEHFSSMGIKPTRSHIFPQLPNVIHEKVGTASTDLCEHGRFLQRHKEFKKGAGRFVLLLNDGVRGPVVSPAYEAAVKAHTGLVEKGVPPWFVPFLYKFAINRDTLLISTVMSAEIESHLQSYALVINSRAVRSMSKTLQVSCDPNMKKLLSIWAGELGASTGILKRGFSIASLWPRINNFTSLHAQCATSLPSESDIVMFNGKHPRAVTCYPTDESYLDFAQGQCTDRVALGYHLLQRRNNPTTIFSGHWGDVVFVKYGGEVFRLKMLRKSLQNQVESRTKKILGLPRTEQGCPLDSHAKKKIPAQRPRKKLVRPQRNRP